ncbi:MAG: IS200/IS605 family transposase [Phycisphaeraceae bacterium]|nr:IS200/IS605 family transposase [Phycisphaeraceae bacterium]
MSQSLSRVLLHVVFSTRAREPLIGESVEAELFAYIGGICREKGCPLLCAGAASDHVHLLVSLGRSISIGDLLLHIKRDSSAWMKSRLGDGFAWQTGYSVFSVSESGRQGVEDYLASQRKRYAARTFQDELRKLCEAHGVSLDERYAWA